MSRTTSTFNALQLFLLMITSTGILIHVIIMPALLQSAGRDAWIITIIAEFLLLLWIFLIYFLSRSIGSLHITDWLQNHIGKIPAFLLIFLFAIEIFIQMFIAIKDTANWTHISYLPNTPYFIITLVITLFCLITAYLGIETIAITNGILLPLVILQGHFVGIGNIPRKDYSYLFPIFQEDIAALFHGLIYVGSGFLEVMFILFLQHRLNKPLRLRTFILIAISFLYLTIGPVVGALTEFGPEIARMQRFPAFEQWRLLTIPQFIEHADFFSIYQWLTGTFIRVSLGLYLIPEIFHVSKKKLKALILILTALLLMVVTCLLPINDLTFLHLLQTIFLPFSFYFLFFFTLLLGVISFITRRKRKNVVSQKEA